MLRVLAEVQPDRPAITCAGRTITRVQLEEGSNRLARVYAELGVGEGSFVTIAFPNGIAHYEAAIAAWKLGAIPQPISAGLPLAERQAVIDLANPALIAGVERGIHSGRVALATGFEAPASIDSSPLPERVAPAWKAPTSGGSTGRPKLIVSGQSGRFDAEKALVVGMSHDGTQLVPGPLYHNAPFLYSAYGLFIGSHLIVLERFDAAVALHALSEHRSTGCYSCPP